MMGLSSNISAPARRQRLAACIAALFTMAAPDVATAIAPAVTNCEDHGPGSLRASILGAGSGDTIDLGSLPCSVVTLTTGALVVNQAGGLVINGPSDGTVGITVQYAVGKSKPYRIVDFESATGDLHLSHLELSYGNKISSSNAYGGCIYSKGNLYVSDSSVHNCTVSTNGHNARGGGIFGKARVTLDRTRVFGNTATYVSSYQVVIGGGVFALNGFYCSYSTITGNSAISPAGQGGGVQADGFSNLYNSTISNNTAAMGAGAVLTGIGDLLKTRIVDSTISGNSSSGLVGGIFIDHALELSNSTIAFNTAAIGKGKFGNYYAAPGLSLSSSAVPISDVLKSSLLSNNTYGTTESDLSSTPYSPGATITISATNNLIRATTAGAATVTQACPLLGPLRNNGGPTPTHALLSHSPAIDVGNNDAGATTDQRGPGFARISPANGSADIGAYEVQKSDIMFDAGFDGCPALP